MTQQEPGRAQHTSAASGTPGIVAICSTPERAQAIAARVAARHPQSLVVHAPHQDDPAIDTPCVVRATGDIADLLDAITDDADIAVHQVAARYLMRHFRSWDIGERSPGVSSIYLTRTKAGLSTDDYHRWWEREHGPKAVRRHMGMWDYEQLSVTRTVRGEAIDGIAVVQWPRPEELATRFTDGPIGTDIIRGDAATFTDLGRLTRFLMDERILVDHPLPVGGTLVVADARHLEVDVPAAALWERLADFGAILDWWPSGLATCTVASEIGIGATRVLTRVGAAPAGRIVERLIELRPAERMLQLSIDEGLPPGIHDYTCRYEVREVDADRCRLDWYPKAVIDADAMDALVAMIDGGWAQISAGLPDGLA